MLGTPAYMSPEQLVDSKSIDARTDVYSVGLVAYRMLAGKLAYERQELRELLGTKRARLASLSEITGAQWPAALDAWIQRATERDRDARFASGAALDAWREVSESLKDFPEPILKNDADDVARLDTDIMPPSMEGT
jgi:serine/threonine protein kinase